MKFSSIATMAIFAFNSAVEAFSASENNNVVLYWGQSSAGSQERLGEYCKSTDADAYVISFISDFPSDSQLTVHGCSGSLDTSCPNMEEDIISCQKLGKKVLLSLGGAVGTYGFTSDEVAAEYASVLWNSFGGGTSTRRPFGTAVVDGFDLDIENGDSAGYTALVTALRKLYDGGDYYVSAAPQCVYPDASMSTVLANAHFDFIFVQFYNNLCNIGSGFNWETWLNYAAKSPNPDVKLYLGLPGSSTAASSGFVDTSEVSEVLAEIQSGSNFGGIMMWDASQAFSNIESGETYVSLIKNLLQSTSGSTSESKSIVGVNSLALPSSSKTVLSTSINAWAAEVSATSILTSAVINKWTAQEVATTITEKTSALAVATQEAGNSVVGWDNRGFAIYASSVIATPTVVLNVPSTLSVAKWTAAQVDDVEKIAEETTLPPLTTTVYALTAPDPYQTWEPIRATTTQAEETTPTQQLEEATTTHQADDGQWHPDQGFQQFANSPQKRDFENYPKSREVVPEFVLKTLHSQ